MNKKLLRKVQKHVATSPESINMDQWTCGTTACICGWALKFSDLVKGSKWTTKGKKAITKLLNEWDVGRGPNDTMGCNVQTLGETILKLTEDEADRLFFDESWPTVFKTAYDNAPKSERGYITAARIAHFIKTNGTDRLSSENDDVY